MRGNQTKWCGPTAISIITGIPYETALDLIKQVRWVGGSYRVQLRPARALRVKGVWWWEMVTVLNRLNRKFTPYSTPKQVTLARWLRERPSKHDMYLVNITGHYIVVSGRKIYDNRFPDGVWLSQYPHRRKRVRRYAHFKYNLAVSRSC